MHNHLGSQPWALGHVMGESNLGSSRGDLAVQSLCGEQQAPSPEAPWAPHSSQPALETLPCKVPYASSQARAAHQGPGKEEGFNDKDGGLVRALHTPAPGVGSCHLRPPDPTEAGPECLPCPPG